MLLVVVTAPFEVVEVELEVAKGDRKFLQDFNTGADDFGTYAVCWDGCNVIDTPNFADMTRGHRKGVTARSSKVAP